MGIDRNGEFLDTVFDVISLGMSVAEVAANPADPWAWASLVGDIVDVVVPGVSGVGEITKSLGAARKAARAVDNAVDAAKVAKNSNQLHRPYIRNATREAVESAAAKAPDGRYLDVHTGQPINGKYDLGHVYGHEFWRERDRAMSLGWTQKQFNDYMNNPKFFQIENPTLNRSHKYEMR